MWMDFWPSWIHISCSASFFPSTLQQQTKKMEKSLSFGAGVLLLLLLTGFLDTALMDVNATAESFLTLTNGTAATTALPVTLGRATDPPAPTTAPTTTTSKSAGTTARAKQLESGKEDNSEEEDSREVEKKLGKDLFTFDIRDSCKSGLTQLEKLIREPGTIKDRPL